MWKHAAFVLTTVAALSSVSSSPSQAQDYRFAYSESELATIGGVGDLYHRISKTAEEVCDRYLRHRRGAAIVRERRRCNADITAALVAKIDHPQLDLVYENAQKPLPRLARKQD